MRAGKLGAAMEGEVVMSWRVYLWALRRPFADMTAPQIMIAAQAGGYQSACTRARVSGRVYQVRVCQSVRTRPRRRGNRVGACEKQNSRRLYWESFVSHCSSAHTRPWAYVREGPVPPVILFPLSAASIFDSMLLEVVLLASLARTRVTRDALRACLRSL